MLSTFAVEEYFSEKNRRKEVYFYSKPNKIPMELQVSVYFREETQQI